MTKFLIISEGGDGVGLAMRLQAEGHEPRIWIRDTEAEHRGEGLIEHAHDYEFGEIVVADCTGVGVLLDNIRENGGRTVGGSVVADRLESDREFATSVMAQAGIRVPKSKAFKSWEDAVEYIKESEAKLVFKPDGKCSGVIPSFCPSDNRELLESIEHFKALIGSTEPEFTLQDFIEGTAVSTEGWFDGTKFIRPFNHTIERKHFLNDDLGPSGGCSGNVVWPVEDNLVVREGILRMEDFLRSVAYRGAIDLNAVVNDDGVWGLEFTPRFGYDAFPTLLYGLYSGNFGNFLYQIARGDCQEIMDVEDRFAAGVKVSLPPWPTEKYSGEAGVPIRGLSQDDLEERFYPYEVSRDKENKLITSGGYGIIGVMNAWGDTIDEAFAKCYHKLSKLKLPDKQYRTDLSHQCINDFNELMITTGDMRDDAWIGVDLDGTLAQYSGYTKHIGEPIPKMVKRVTRWIAQGKQVKILTARVAPRKEEHEQRVLIHEWVKEHIGYPLEVTSHKDYRMQVLWDDRVEPVEANTGKRML